MDFKEEEENHIQVIEYCAHCLTSSPGTEEASTWRGSSYHALFYPNA
jgi:hypothetical protein